MFASVLVAFFCLASPEWSPDRDSLERLLKSTPSDLPAEWYLDFTANGNRTRYQKPYGERISTLEKLLACEDADRTGGCVAKIAEYVEAIASERSWTMPAHDAQLTSWNGTPHVDLGAGRRGQVIAEALAICGDKLPAAVREKAGRELERRLFDPYLKSAAGEKISGHWWFHGNNNWNAVCHKCVVIAAISYYPYGSDARRKIVDAAVAAVPYFLSGFTDDGYCSEGAGYWNYGLGHFILMAAALQASEERIDLFALFPKTRSIAKYGFEYKLTKRSSPLFADGGGTPEDVYLRKCSAAWPELSLKLGPRSEFADAQVCICRPANGAGGLSLGFKGGHNNEFHNHNDLGSYDIALGGTIVTGDIGGEVYSRRTFSSQRYESKVLSSYAHPVPRLAGTLQGTGAKFAAKVVSKQLDEDVDTVKLDLTKAYACPKLVSFFRTFAYDRRGGAVTVRDEVKFSGPASFEDPLVTLGAFDGDSIVFGGKRLRVAVTAKGGDWTWWTETVENPGKTSPQIKGVRFASVTEAEVEFRFVPE